VAEKTGRACGFRAAAETVYAVLTGASLLGSLLAILSWSPGWVTPVWLILLRCAAAATGLLLWDRKDWGFRILAVYLLLVFLRVAVPSPGDLFVQRVSETLFNGAWAFFACYSLGHVLKGERAERFMKWFWCGWVLVMACYSGIAVYAAWTDQRIWNIGQGAYWGLGIVSGEGSSRLKMFFDSNTSGLLFGIPVTAAVICAAGQRSKGMKVFHLLALVPCWVALSLTDSRAAQIGAAAGIGCTAGILLLRKMRDGNPEGKKGPAWAAAAGAALAVAAACVALMIGTTSAFSALKTNRGEMIPAASAESGAEEDDGQFRAYVKQYEVTGSFEETIQIKVRVKNAEGELRYQWQSSKDHETWTDLKRRSAQKKILKLTVNNSTYDYVYRCVVTADNGTAMTEEITIRRPFTVKLSPSTKKSAAGDTVTITAVADGAEGELSYRWLVSEDDGKTWQEAGDGKAGRTLTVDVKEERRYRCIVTADNGTSVSKSKTIKKPSGTKVESRGFGGEDPLTGRTRIWKQVVRFLADNPRTLLAGRSVNMPMQNTGIMRTETIETEHCHNIFLQALMESGIPGLLLVLAFLALTVKRAVSLAADREQPLLIRLMPAAAAALWVGEMADSIVRMSNARVPTLAILMLYSGVICAAGKRNAGQKKDAE